MSSDRKSRTLQGANITIFKISPFIDPQDILVEVFEPRNVILLIFIEH